MTMNPWQEYISKVDLFFGLSAPEREALLTGAREVELRKKDVLCQAHAAASHFYVVVRGALKTVQDGRAEQRLVVDFLKSGEVLGDENVFLSGDNEVTACPLETAAVLAIPLDNIRRVVDGQPRLARALAALSASRARALRERLFLMTTASVPSRLAASLHTLARRFGKRDRKGTMIALRLTHQDLAEHVGASRETVSNFISRFRKESLITIATRRIIVPDMKALKKAAEEK